MKLRASLMFVACSVSLPALAADDATIQRTLSDWGANNKRFTSVRYTLAGTLELKNPDAGSKKKSGDVPYTHPLTATVLIDFPNRRWRIESSGPRPAMADRTKIISDYKVSTYNGKSAQTHIPRGRNERGKDDEDLAIATGNLRPQQIDRLYWPILTAHGFVPSVYHFPYLDRLPGGYDLDEFDSVASGELNGRRCTILRTVPDMKSYDEYWIDPTRSNCVVRHVLFSNKTNPFYRFDINYQLVGGAWLPKNWSNTHSADHSVVHIERFDVTKLEIDPVVSDSDFTIPITPDMIVKEYKYPDAGSGLDPARPAVRTSRVKRNGEQEVTAETGFTTTGGEQLPPASDRTWWWLAAVAGSLVAFAVGWAWRRRHRTTVPPAG